MKVHSNCVVFNLVMICHYILITLAVSTSSSSFDLKLKNGRIISNVTGRFEVATTIKCGMHCQSKVDCVGFNVGSEDKKSLVCELVSKRFEGNNWEYTEVEHFTYYEKHCDIPKDYCNGRGVLTNNVKCGETKCSCEPFFIGSQCETECQFKECVGCDLVGPRRNLGAVDLIKVNSPDLQPCLVNCTLWEECESMLYNGNRQLCIYKSESMLKRNISVTSTSAKTNVVYSKQCH